MSAKTASNSLDRQFLHAKTLGFNHPRNGNRLELSLGTIGNSGLQNSSFTIGTDSISLGGSITSIAGLSLTGNTTVDLTGAGSKLRFDFAGYGSLPAFGSYTGMFAFDTVGNRPYYSSGSGWVRILDENASVSAHTDVNTTGIADGNVLAWSSAQGRFNATATKSGSQLTIADEGGDLSTAATKLDFVGTGVTASGTGSTKTITIDNSLTVQEDGSSLSTAATTLNFVGSGVVASGTGAVKTITIAGGGGSLASRTTKSATTASLNAAASGDLDITNAFKGYHLLKIAIDHPAWVRLYTSTVTRGNDASRAEGTDPAPGSGVIAEVLTSTAGASSFVMSPGVFGWSDESTPSTTVYARVTNKDSSARAITVTLTLIQAEA